MPAPDAIARDYLLLALRMERVRPGLVETYYGPAELKAIVDAEPALPAAHLRNEASILLARIGRKITDPDREGWLNAQMVALEAQALAMTGDPLPFADYVACCFDLAPDRTPDAVFAAAADDLARVLPADDTAATVADRLTAWEDGFALDPDRLPAVLDWLVARMRDRSDRLFGLPTGERVEIGCVSGATWASQSRYEGGYRTRFDVNVDLVSRPADLIGLVIHELYPGRHTDHAWKERHLVTDKGLLEHSIHLRNTPAALLGEGLCHMGERIAAPDDAYPDLLLEVYGRGGLAIAHDQPKAQEAAEREVRIRRARSILRAVPANAAFLLHADGAPRAEVAAYLERFMLTTPEQARRQLALIEDPVHRTHVIVRFEGERLLRRWFELGPSSEQYDRFGRLLREALTPSAIEAEVPSFGRGSW